MSVKLLTEHHLEFLSLKGGCTGSSESTHVKIPHCWKSRVTAKLHVVLVQLVAGQIINIRIYHECEGRIEKSVPRITVWHHEACQVMTNGDSEGRIFISFSRPNNGFFFLLTIKYHILF